MNNGAQKPENAIVPDDFVDQIFHALVENGSIIPESADEVQRALSRLKLDPGTLPAHLRDPSHALARLREPADAVDNKIVPIPINHYVETLESLQRAARKGDEISAHVETRMKDNRLKARHERQA